MLREFNQRHHRRDFLQRSCQPCLSYHNNEGGSRMCPGLGLLIGAFPIGSSTPVVTVLGRIRSLSEFDPHFKSTVGRSHAHGAASHVLHHSCSKLARYNK